MRSFTDIFIKHPVLAVVVNLVILLVGYRSITSLPVQQYPKIESSQVLITTVYYGASAETIRGFLTTPIERAVSAISGVDYVESTSRAGVSSITIHLKLNHNSTAALAEVTARLQQVRSELPAEAEPPVVEVQRADRPYASFYLSFTSTRAGHSRAHRLARPATCSPSSRRCRVCSGWTWWVAARLPCGSGSIPTAWPHSTSLPATCTRRCSATTTSRRWARPRTIWFRSTCSPTPTCALLKSSRT